MLPAADATTLAVTVYAANSAPPYQRIKSLVRGTAWFFPPSLQPQPTRAHCSSAQRLSLPSATSLISTSDAAAAALAPTGFDAGAFSPDGRTLFCVVRVRVRCADAAQPA